MAAITVFHGTCASASESIARDGLRPQGDHLSVFVTTSRDVARLYAWAWTGFAISDEAEMYESEDSELPAWQPEPTGALIVVSVDEARLDPDPYNPNGEPEQFRVAGGIDANEIDHIELFSMYGLRENDEERSHARRYRRQVSRARWNPNFRTENPVACTRCGRTSNEVHIEPWADPAACIHCTTRDEHEAHARDSHAALGMSAELIENMVAQLRAAWARSDQLCDG